MKVSEKLLLIGIATIAVLVVVLILPRRVGPPKLATCANSLKQIGLSLKMYEHEHGQYPSLAREAGRLMFNSELVYPDYVPDLSVLHCPQSAERRKRIETFVDPIWAAKSDAEKSAVAHRAIDDFDYMYTGYRIASPEDGIRFIRAYARAALEGRTGGEIVKSPHEIEPALVVLRDAPEAGVTADMHDVLPVMIERLGRHDADTRGHVYESCEYIYAEGLAPYEPDTAFNVYMLNGAVYLLNIEDLESHPTLSKEFVLGLNMLAELDELPPDERQQRLEMLANYGL